MKPGRAESLARSDSWHADAPCREGRDYGVWFASRGPGQRGRPAGCPRERRGGSSAGEKGGEARRAARGPERAGRRASRRAEDAGGGAPGPFTPQPPRQRKFRCRRAEVRGQQEVDTWPPPVPAEEALRAEMAAQLNVEQLEVSLDGLTLSPDSEERPGAEGAPLQPSPASSPGAGRGPGAAGQPPEPGEAAAEGAAEEARRMEQHWGFGLEELYGLALRFFKSERGTRLCGAAGRPGGRAAGRPG